MIQLANDPDASRAFQRPDPSRAKAAAATEERPVRSGHAWPFLSRYAARPARQEGADKPAAQDSGS